MNLRTQLAVFIATAVGSAVAAVAFVAYGFAATEARVEVDDFLQERGPGAGLLGAFELEGFRDRPGRGGSPFVASPGPFGDVIREDAIAQFVESNGTAFTLGLSPVVLPVEPIDLEIAGHGGPDHLRDVEVDGVHYRMLTRPLIPGVAMQVARDVTGVDDLLGALRIRLTLLGTGGVALAALVGWLIARRSLLPVAVLTEAAEHVASTRELEARITVDRDDELGRLAAAFNGMLAALEESRASQQRLVADASHELRTPLTSLRTNIELLARNAVDEDELDDLLDELTSEVGELSHLVAELVDLSIIGRDQEPVAQLDLADIVNQGVQRLRRHTDLVIDLVVEPTPITGRSESLLRSVSNLLDNAAKWGAGGTGLEVRLIDREFSVRDHGPGIPEADLPGVFERFYRSPQARSMPGSGLGLSIVAAVTEDHGGEVFARNAPDGGAIVGFSLPICGA